MTERTITAEWADPTTILIGNGRARELIACLQNSGCNTTLLIIDKTIEGTPALKKILKSFDHSTLAFGVFSFHGPYVDDGALSNASRIFASGHFDSIAAIGQQGALDLAKHIAFNHTTPHDFSEKPVSIFTLPICANNGAEICDNAFLMETDGPGRFISDKRLRPAVVILDPGLLPLAASKPLLASAAMNTLAQALGAWCSADFNPAQKAIAGEAIRLIFNYLPIALSNDNDTNARIMLMSAAIMVYSKSDDRLGTTAALAQALSVLCNIDCGLACGVLMPHVLMEYLNDTGPRMEALAQMLHIRGGAGGFITALLKLRRQAGIPTKLTGLLKDRKIKTKDKIQIEIYAASYPPLNPRLMTQKATIAILNAALSGKMKRNK